MSEFKQTFELHPETLKEASERLGESENVYDRYLAQELKWALKGENPNE